MAGAAHHAKFREELIALSCNKIFVKALKEWEVVDLFFAEEPNHCICGHQIVQNCLIQNSLNGEQRIVGNCCVKHVMLRDGFDGIFAALRKIKDDSTASAGAKLANYCFDAGIINSWEHTFLISNARKRTSTRSDSQIDKRMQINAKILRKMVKGTKKHLPAGQAKMPSHPLLKTFGF